MKNILLIGTLAVGAVAFGVGCVAHAEATGSSEADAPVAFSEEPTLVAVEPDVWVVRDYDYTVYYVDDYYWVYRGDVWHRSRTYQGGWTTVEATVVPKLIVSRDPHAYVHYHGAANAQVRAAPRVYTGAASVAETRHDPPGRADDHHDGPTHPDKDKGPTLPERADDHHDGPPGHDDRASNERREDAENGSGKESVRRDDNIKKEERPRNDPKKAEKKDKRKGDKK